MTIALAGVQHNGDEILAEGTHNLMIEIQESEPIHYDASRSCAPNTYIINPFLFLGDLIPSLK